MVEIKACPRCNYPLQMSVEKIGDEKWLKIFRCINCKYMETETQEGRKQYELICPKCGRPSITYEDFWCDGMELKINLICEDCGTHYVAEIPWS